MSDGHRLTPTERLHEITMAFASRAASPPEHSCDLSRNAKGVWQVGLTVRGHDLEAVLADAIAGAAELDRAYPYRENGEPANEGQRAVRAR